MAAHRPPPPAASSSIPAVRGGGGGGGGGGTISPAGLPPYPPPGTSASVGAPASGTLPSGGPLTPALSIAKLPPPPSAVPAPQPGPPREPQPQPPLLPPYQPLPPPPRHQLQQPGTALAATPLPGHVSVLQRPRATVIAAGDGAPSLLGEGGGPLTGHALSPSKVGLDDSGLHGPMGIVIGGGPSPPAAPLVGPPVTAADLGGALVPTIPAGGELRVSVNRCDLMWSANNPVSSELFTPVKACEIDPSVIIKDATRGRYIDDDDDVREAGAVTHYRWSRGPAQAVCFFHPHRPAQIQCTVTLRCYCCYHCCNRGYRQLRRFYASGGKCSLPRQSNEFSYGVPSHKGRAADLEALREVDSQHYKLLTQAGLVVDCNSVRWQPISYERNYTPTKDDVGHQLRFEVIVLSMCNLDAASHEGRGQPVVMDDSAPAVRVITSAGDAGQPLSATPSQQQPTQTAACGQPGQPAPPQGPRSSPMSLARQVHISTTTPAAESAFWFNWDKYMRQHTHDTRALGTISDAYKVIETACVISQAPMVGPRPIVPVGILALFSDAQESFQTPQRIIPPGSSLARALGIGIGAERGWQARRKALRASDPIHSRLADRFASEKSAGMATVAERREALLTDGTWTSWVKGETATGIAGAGAVGHRDSPPPRVILPKGSRLRGVTPGSVSKSGDGPESLTVMTWNVLADIYATSEAYPLCEAYALAWRYRKDRLVAEIINNDPDIVCLQEVQADHFEEFFAPALLRRGYEGLYKQKVSQVFRGDGRRKGGKYVADGCATFFKVPKFRLMDHFGIEFSRVAPPPARGGDGKSDKRINKDNVALVLCLDQLIVGPGGGTAASGSADSGADGASASPKMPKGETRKLVVANTHILANPEAPDVKIWQTNTLTSVLTEYMEKSVTLAQLDRISKVPGLIVCGDFNSTPDSAVYQLVCAGQCDANHAELHSSDVYRWLRDVTLGHRLHLRSSYGAASYMRREAERALAATGTTAGRPGGDPGGGGGGGGPGTATTQGGIGVPPGISGALGPAVTGSGHSNPPVLTDADLEPEFTNYTHQYVGCLDYIFYDDRCLKLTGTLELLTEVQLLEEAHELQRSDWALPSPQRPSDHTPLMSRFEWLR